MKHQTYFFTETEENANIENTTAEIRINCAGAVNLYGGIDTCRERNDYYLMYMISGQLGFECGGVNRFLSEGDLLVIPPHTLYHYFSCDEKNVTYLWLHFTGYRAGELLELFGITPGTVYFAGVRSVFPEKWREIFREFIINDSFSNEMHGALFKELAAAFARFINEKSGGVSFLKTIAYIKEHYGEKLTLRELAATADLSESYFRMRFRESVGMTVTDFIIKTRIEAAASLLDTTDKTLEEIAAETGFYDVYHFGKLFKKRVGISPGRYRRKNVRAATAAEKARSKENGK